MIDSLLKYYNKELSYIRRSALEFSKRYPKVASRLRLGDNSVEDPHVGRLVESVAYMNARISKKLDDDFPELTAAMLGVLYPHYLAPIPSMSIVKMDASDSLGEASVVPTGTEIKTEEVNGEPCYFRTTSDVQLLPLSVVDAKFMGGAYAAPTHRMANGAKSALKLVLRCQNEKLNFESLDPENIRFYLKGDATHVNQLYNFLFNQLETVAIADHQDDSQALFLDKKSVKQVGFDSGEGMLPYSAQSFIGYRLITEFFVFPQKFLFFDFSLLDKDCFLKRGQTIELFFYFNSESTELERNIDASTFVLGCAPVVNLFKYRAEPVRLNHQTEEYHISADTNHPLSKEIYSIDSVVATSNTEEMLAFKPFYNFNHASDNEASMYWHAVRRAPEVLHSDQLDGGTEMYMSLVDLSFKTIDKTGWTLSNELTCLNRDLPERLPYGGGQPYLSLVSSDALVRSVSFLTAPTPTKRLYADNELRWRLISHLNLNYSSMLEGPNATSVLKEVLKLYNFDDSPSSNALIEAIVDIKSRQIMSRVSSRSAIGGMCRGIEITLLIDENRFESNGLFLFGSILERFFALFSPINSFTRLVLSSPNREVPIRKWPPRAGEKQLA